MTTERCQRASAIDPVTFLDHPGDAEWEEFNQHVRACEDCAAAIARWQLVEGTLKTFGEEVRDTHPPAESLAFYRHTPQRLPTGERTAIGQHLRYCSFCREELSLASSFDFARLRGETAKQPVVENMGERITASVASFFANLSSLLLRPAVAYAVALIVSAPAIFSYLSPTLPLDSTRSSGRFAAPEYSPAVSGHLPTSGTPEAIAQVLLRIYQSAYQARDLNSLQQVWDMGPEKHDALATLFEKTHSWSVLTDLNEVRVEEPERRLVIRFTEASMWVEDDTVRYDGPFRSTAELRRDPQTGTWTIVDLDRQPLT